MTGHMFVRLWLVPSFVPSHCLISPQPPIWLKSNLVSALRDGLRPCLHCPFIVICGWSSRSCVISNSAHNLSYLLQFCTKSHLSFCDLLQFEPSVLVYTVHLTYLHVQILAKYDLYWDLASSPQSHMRNYTLFLGFNTFKWQTNRGCKLEPETPWSV